jgi:hypothetical protein
MIIGAAVTGVTKQTMNTTKITASTRRFIVHLFLFSPYSIHQPLPVRSLNLWVAMMLNNDY